MRYPLTAVAIVAAAAAHAAPPAKSVVIEGTPTVVVTNAPDVNVANIPDVIIANDETSPVPVAVQNGMRSFVEYRYVGLTAATTNGLPETGVLGAIRGYAAMNRFCETEFGPGARMASPTEVSFRSDALETVPGWIHPGSDVTIAEDAGGRFILFSPDGLRLGESYANPAEAFSRLACRQYRDSSSAFDGIVSGMADQSTSTPCDQIRPVACSAPVEIPVRSTSP